MTNNNMSVKKSQTERYKEKLDYNQVINVKKLQNLYKLLTNNYKKPKPMLSH